MSSNSLVARLCRARVNGIVDADAGLLAEVFWLATLLEDAAGSALAPTQSANELARAEPAPLGDTALPAPGPGETWSGPGLHTGVPGGDVPLFPELAPGRPSRTVAASFLNVPTGDPLPQRHQLERALKPFKRRFPSRHDRVLDAVATAEQSAECRAITPVYRAARERWFDVALITDATDGMHVWKESLEELQRLLARHGAFRQARLWRYTVRDGSLSLASNSGYVVPPRTIADPQGRRVFIFLTNGTSRVWSDPTLVDFIDLLGQKCPTAIIQMMPRRAWPHTALGDALAQATSLTRGEATKRLRVRNRFTGVNEPATNALTVPMLPMEPEAIAKWAQFLMGPRCSVHSAVKLQRKTAAASTEETEAPNIASRALRHENTSTPAQRVTVFRSIASPQAYQLMRLMAGVPLSLPVIRLLHASMDGERKQSHLAEVLLSGLIERRAPTEVPADPDTVQYEFKEGVRDALLESLSVDETHTIDGAVKSMRAQAREFVTVHAGVTQHEFRAMVSDAVGQHAMLQAAESFLDISEEILRKLYPGRDISQIGRTAAPSDVGPGVAAPSLFYSERRVIAELRASAALHQTEQVTGTLLIYSTDSQHTWLIATKRALLFVLDDASTRASGNLVQRAESWFDVLPVAAERSADAALVGFGSPTNSQWYYSPELFPEPESLEFDVAELAPGGVHGPLPQVGVMAREYEKIRETMRPGDRRTTAMARLVEDMRRMLALRPFDLGLAVTSNCAGSRLAAVINLQEHFQLEHAGWLVRLLEDEHAFLAFQAAGALLNSVPLQDIQARNKLRLDVLNAMKSLNLRGLVDQGVHGTAADIVSAINSLDKANRVHPARGSSASDEPSSCRWILVAGTGTEIDVLPANLQTACKALGHELAQEGFGLITGGWPGVDELVAKRFAEQLGLDDDVLAERFIQFMKPKQARLSPYGKLATVGPGLAQYSEPIAKCDALILIGGLGGTLQMAQMATKAGRLVLPLAATGGDAAKYHSLLRFSKIESTGGLNRRELDSLAQSLPGAVHEAIKILNQRLA
jgi:hypothetical protein